MAAATAVYRNTSVTSTTTSSSILVSDASLSQISRMDDQQYITTFFCRAKYDYQSADDASLSFRRGDIIEVLTRLETGWWDGLLGEGRGWFPANYVVVISDEEADATLSASEYQQELQRQQQHQHQLQLVSQDDEVIIPLSQNTSTLSSLAASSETAVTRSHP